MTMQVRVLPVTQIKTKTTMEFGTILLISYAIGFFIALCLSVYAWIKRDRETWNTSLMVWFAMILLGCVLGFIALIIFIIFACNYVVEQRFKG